MPADILRDREMGKDVDPASAVQVGAEAPERPAFPDLAAQIGPALTQNRTLIERAQREREAAVAAEQAARDRQAAEMKSALSEARAALTAPRPLPPPPPVFTPPPSRKLSDFLAPVKGEAPENTIAKLIQGVSLMAAGFTGLARGDAKAALAGLHGALKGWREGDKDRADRAFADWEAASGKLLKDWEVRHKTYRDLMEDGNQAIADRLKFAELKAIELGHDVAAATFRTGEANKALEFLQGDRDALFQALYHAAVLAQSKELKELGEQNRLAIAEMTNETRIEAARIAAGGKKEAQDRMLGESAAKWENAEGERPAPTMTITEASAAGFRPVGKISSADARRSTYTLIDQIEALIPKLEVKGFLASGPGSGELLRVRARRSQYLPGIGRAGDPDLVAWLAHAGTMVSIQRQLGDIGPRALAAYESAVDVIREPTSADGARQALENLRAAIQETDARTRAAPAPPRQGETVSRTNPAYQRARASGLTDAQIEEKYHVKIGD